MSGAMESIRDHYGVPVRRGAVVRLKCDPDGVEHTRCGRITSADGSFLRVRWHGEGKPGPRTYHPLDLEYVERGSESAEAA